MRCSVMYGTGEWTCSALCEITMPREWSRGVYPLAADAPASVHHQGVAGDRLRVVAQEEEGGAGHVLGIDQVLDQGLLGLHQLEDLGVGLGAGAHGRPHQGRDRKSTRLNSS